jgi:hypothetical protein
MKCTNQTGLSSRDHFFIPLPRRLVEYTDFILQQVTGNIDIAEYETCSYFTSTSSRGKTCGMTIQFQTGYQTIDNQLGIDHVQGQGKVRSVGACPVIFDCITPNDTEATPYILWCSTGVHNHAPPPIHKVPLAIRTDIVNLFVRMNNPDLTISMYQFWNTLILVQN